MVWSSALLVLSASLALAKTLPDGRRNANMRPSAAMPRVSLDAEHVPVVSRDGTELPPYNTTYWFDQLIDHNDTSKGTFKQRYWHTYEHYEAGGPIIITTPGEGNADGYYTYLTNKTINGLLAKQESGAAIVIEHRFYGESNPYDDLSVESLEFLNIQQAIEDFVYFAENVELPQPNGGEVGPDKAPWVYIGGSYSGALTGWILNNKPGVFFAGYGSSGVVEAIVDFWEYFEPIRQNMPANCSADVEAVISHIDEVFSGNDTEQITEIKESFGLGDLEHLDDVAGALRNNLWDWQSLQPSTGAGAQFFNFCDALELKESGEVAGEEGWGLEYALPAWASYWKNEYFETLCGNETTAEECLGTYDKDSDYYTDISVDNSGRSWTWQVCNEVGYYQIGAPKDKPSIVTRLAMSDYDLRTCSYMFPEAFPEPIKHEVAEADIAATNARYGGWDIQLKNAFFANGYQDPWRDATLSAESQDIESTDDQPIHISNGFHCSDLNVRNTVDPTVKEVQDAGLKALGQWLATYEQPTSYPEQGYNGNGMGRGNGVSGFSSGAQGGKPRHAAKKTSAWFAGAGEA